MRGLKGRVFLYFEKYGTDGPEFGIKEEFLTERGKQGGGDSSVVRAPDS